MIYKVGMLCKHFKGFTLLDKNIYEIIKIGVNGNELSDDITYTGDGNVSSASNLVVYANIFQNYKLFAREYDDISSELPDDMKNQFGQIIKVQPLTDDEIEQVKDSDFIENKKKAVASKFKEKQKK